jgi:hypothetical protein
MPRRRFVYCLVVVVCLLSTPYLVVSQSNYGSEGHIAREPDYGLPLKPALFNKWKARDITVRGRIVYDRPPNGACSNAATIGVDNAEVEVHDDDPIINEVKVSGSTDADGNFSLTFHWQPVQELEANPDIFIKVKTQNAHVRVEDPYVEFIAYSWRSSTTNKYSGTDLDLGTQNVNTDKAAFHILTNLTRAWRWSNDRGHNVGFVEVKWPSNDLLPSHYSASTATLHIQQEDSWREVLHVHEWGHHWTNSLAVWEMPTYFNPHCTVTGHCHWCSENSTAAYLEGFANWLSDTIVQSFEPASCTRDNDVATDLLAKCTDPDDLTFNDPYTTEGFFSALLRDIEDDTPNDDDPHYPNDNYRDVLALGVDEILDVADFDGPLSPVAFLNAFIARYPHLACDLWDTARNNGFEVPPGAVTDLTAHPGGPAPPLACGEPTHAIRFTWSGDILETFCMTGYSVLISGSQQMPDAIAELGNVYEYTTPCLGPGTYWFNIRARDPDGLWSNQYASYQFQFSGPPTMTQSPSLTAKRVGSDVRLTWNTAAADVRTYTVYRANASGVTPIPRNQVGEATDTVLVDPSAPTTALYYMVVANDDGKGRSAMSNEAGVEAAGGPPALSAFTVRQNHPNPFSTATELEIGLVAESRVEVEVFDVMGRRVASLAPRTLGSGWQRIVLESRDDHGRALPNGVYFYRVRANGSQVGRKMVIAR